MDIKGYMIEGTWDGSTLTVKGTTKPSQIALAGVDQPDAVVLPRSTIAAATFKPAGIMTNGLLDIRTHDGRRYQLHFLRKHTATFEQLHAAIA